MKHVSDTEPAFVSFGPPLPLHTMKIHSAVNTLLSTIRNVPYKLLIFSSRKTYHLETEIGWHYPHPGH